MNYEFEAKVKDPAATLFHAHNIAPWLDVGETITQKTVTSSAPAELIVDQVTESNGRVTYRVRGGIAGKNYLVTCSVTTSAGRTDEKTVRYRVRQR